MLYSGFEGFAIYLSSSNPYYSAHATMLMDLIGVVRCQTWQFKAHFLQSSSLIDAACSPCVGYRH